MEDTLLEQNLSMCIFVVKREPVVWFGMSDLGSGSMGMSGQRCIVYGITKLGGRDNRHQ